VVLEVSFHQYASQSAGQCPSIGFDQPPKFFAMREIEHNTSAGLSLRARLLFDHQSVIPRTYA
jgi:hypothetical protein